jgi:hypothetical protein
MPKTLKNRFYKNKTRNAVVRVSAGSVSRFL